MSQIATHSLQCSGAPQPDRCPKLVTLAKAKAVAQTASESLRITGRPHRDNVNRWGNWAAPQSISQWCTCLCVFACACSSYTVRFRFLKEISASGSATKAQVAFASDISDILFHPEPRTSLVSGSLGCAIKPAVDTEQRRQLTSYLCGNDCDHDKTACVPCHRFNFI